MKNILLGVLLLYPGLLAIGQGIDSLGYKEKMDRLLRPLDPGRYPSGILYDRVEPWANLVEAVEGQVREPESTLHFWTALEELRQADYHFTGNPVEVTEAQIRQQVDFTRKKKLPIGILNFDFETIDTGSFRAGILISEDDQIKLNPDKASETYFRSHLYRAAVILGEGLMPGRYTLKADHLFWFSNRTEQISWIEMTRPGIRTDTLFPGDSLVLELSEGSKMEFQIRVVWSSGNVSEHISTLSTATTTETVLQEWELADDDSFWMQNFKPCGGIRSEPITASIPFKGYEPGDISLFGQAEYSIYKRSSDEGQCGLTSLRKPILILDGFDPRDQRKAECLYGKYLRYFDGTGQNQSLGALLRGAGQSSDLVILNFKDWFAPDGKIVHGGADYVERNAMVVVEMIQKINAALAQNGSPEKLVVIGTSMGGLISRYALSYMEKHGLNHNCKLWISFDAPHLGANISLSVQHFLQFWSENDVPEAKAAIGEELGSVAARQMLLYHHTAGSGVVGPSPVFRANFLQNQAQNGKPGSFGWPQDCRRISLVNGSLSGTKIGTGCAAGTQLEVFLQFKAFSLFNWLYRQVFKEVRVGMARTSTLPDQGSCTIFEGYRFGGTTTNSSFSITAQGPVSCTPDNAPGGSIPIFATIDGSATSGGHTPLVLGNFKTYLLAHQLITGNHLVKIAALLGLISPNPINTIGGRSFGLGTRTVFQSGLKESSFIPTKSALGFHWNQSGPGYWDEAIDNRNLYCTGEIPFHAYFGEEQNTPHVSLSKAKVDWLMGQFLPNPPPDNLVQLQLKQEPTPCPVFQETVSVVNPFPGAQYNWTLLSGSTIVGQATGTSKVINFGSGNPPNQVQIQMSLANCTSGVFSFPLQPQGIAPAYFMSKQGGICPGNKVKVRIKGQQAGDALYWTATNPEGNLLPVTDFPGGIELTLPTASNQLPIKVECVVAHGGCSRTNTFLLEEEPDVDLPDFHLSCENTQTGRFCFGDPKIRFAIPLSEIPGGTDVFWTPNYTAPGSAAYTLEPEESYGLYRAAEFNFFQTGTLTFKVRIEKGCSVKERSFNFDFQTPPAYPHQGRYCYSCQYGIQYLQVFPNPMLQGSQEQVEVRLAEGITFPVDGKVLDATGRVVTRFHADAPPVLISASQLGSAAYQVQVQDAAGRTSEQPWLILEKTAQEAVVSPNPAWKGQDNFAWIDFLEGTTMNGPIKVEIENLQGELLQSFDGQGNHIPIELDQLNPGAYRIRVHHSTGVWEEMLNFQMKGQPWLDIRPNPVHELLSGELMESSVSEGQFKITVADKLGQIRKTFELTETKFELNIADLPPDLYYLYFFDGSLQTGRIFRKE